MRGLRPVCCLFLLTGCSLMPGSSQQEFTAIDELRLELSELRHSLSSARVEVQLLEEKLNDQDVKHSLGSQNSAKDQNRYNQLALQVAMLEKKISQLETTREQVVHDLHELAAHMGDYQQKLSVCEERISSASHRLDEVHQLKGTLTHISRAMQGQSGVGESVTLYRVMPGDSLERIAKNHHSTVEVIKKLNGLVQDKIRVGQEIRVPSSH